MDRDVEHEPVLALDCGGTKSKALLIQDGRLVGERDFPGANIHLAGPGAVAALVEAACGELDDAQAVALSLAGLRTDHDRGLVLAALARIGLRQPFALFSDVEAGLRAASLHHGIVVVAGTGSAAYARGLDGTAARAGGWGNRLGDEGSGYWMGREALARVVRAHDAGDTSFQTLEVAILAHYAFERVDRLRELTGREDGPARIAGLVPVLSALWSENEPYVRAIVDEGASELARIVQLVGARVKLPVPCPVILAGGVSQSLPALAPLVSKYLGEHFAVTRLESEPAWGAYWLALEQGGWVQANDAEAVPKTEQENPRTQHFARLSTLERARIMNDEDRLVAPAVARVVPEIARLVEEVSRRLSEGGRLIYVGAGTSGRLALIDAAECVPTFGISPQQVVALLAGGREAMGHAVEGAEDDVNAGQADLRALVPSQQDAVVGLSASGRTPYVGAALRAGRAAGCLTGAIVCRAWGPLGRDADICIAVDPGPEVIAGSTRLKAGTAQKLILNMISTLAMVQLGRTVGNKMIGVRSTNAKLRERSIRLVSEITGARTPAAQAALEEAEWDVALASLALHLGSVEQAHELLEETNPNIAEAFRRAGLK